MTRISISIALAALCVLAAAAVGSARTTAGSPPCFPKETKAGGKVTVANCGPATATLKLKGKTYTFKSGFCSTSQAANGALSLELGTLVMNGVKNIKGNAGKPYFAMTLTKSGGKVWGSVFSASVGGKDILGDSLVDAKGGFPAKGTFVSNLTTQKFTGSWDCKGVVYKGP